MVIHNPSQPHVMLEVRLLLDSGRQRSYISEHAWRLLYLDAIGKQSLYCATCGSQHVSVKVCPVVNVGMHLTSMSLLGYVMPTICEPLVAQPTVACIEQHSNLIGLKQVNFSRSKSICQ